MIFSCHNITITHRDICGFAVMNCTFDMLDIYSHSCLKNLNNKMLLHFSVPYPEGLTEPYYWDSVVRPSVCPSVTELYLMYRNGYRIEFFYSFLLTAIYQKKHNLKFLKGVILIELIYKLLLPYLTYYILVTKPSVRKPTRTWPVLTHCPNKKLFITLIDHTQLENNKVSSENSSRSFNKYLWVNAGILVEVCFFTYLLGRIVGMLLYL